MQQEEDSFQVSQKIISSKKMTKFMESIKEILAEQKVGSPSSATSFARSRMSLMDSDFSEDEWPSPNEGDDHFGHIVDQISHDKPVHVKLAGYETLLRSDAGNVWNHAYWEALLKTLRDGISDDSRPVFEASLRMHARMLGSFYPAGDKVINWLMNFYYIIWLFPG